MLARTGRATRDTSTPLAGPRSSGRGGSLTGRSTRCIPRPPPPPLLACPPEGREEEEEDAPGCLTSEEVYAQAEVFGAGGTEPEGREWRFLSAYDLFLAKSFHCAKDQPAQMSQVKSQVQILPLHPVQVGWGFLSREDRKAHFLPPTPGHNRNSLDIANRENRWKILKCTVEETPIHPPMKTKMQTKGRTTRRERSLLNGG